jgi:hypothetical protein
LEYVAVAVRREEKRREEKRREETWLKLEGRY